MLWTVPTEGAGKKGTGRELVFPEIAFDIIKAQPRFETIPYVLAGRYRGAHFSNYGNAKATFDAKLPSMPQWGLHDLRRTAKSLMARAGVRPDISEQVLGHAQTGVEGIYDRHSYREEKAHALKALAGLNSRIYFVHQAKRWLGGARERGLFTVLPQGSAPDLVEIQQTLPLC